MAIMLATLVMAVAIPDVRVEGSPVRRLVRRHPGGSAPVPDLRVREAGDDRARTGAGDPRLVLRGGGVLDRGRARRGRGAGRSLAGGAGNRLCRAGVPLPRPGSSAARSRDMGRGDRPLRRALPAVRHHRARRVDRADRGTTADLDIDAARLSALGLAFAGTAALWWLYFDYVAPIAQRRLELAENRTLLLATATRTSTSS